MNKILIAPIERIPSSNEFQDICKQNSFNTLKDVLNTTIENLEYEHGFSKRMIIELMGFVKEYGLREYVKEGDW